jgi:hypothetical protein
MAQREFLRRERRCCRIYGFSQRGWGRLPNAFVQPVYSNGYSRPNSSGRRRRPPECEHYRGSIGVAPALRYSFPHLVVISNDQGSGLVLRWTFADSVAVRTTIADRLPQSGRTVERSGLRMMPTCPPSLPYQSVRRVFPSTGRLSQPNSISLSGGTASSGAATIPTTTHTSAPIANADRWAWTSSASGGLCRNLETAAASRRRGNHDISRGSAPQLWRWQRERNLRWRLSGTTRSS